MNLEKLKPNSLNYNACEINFQFGFSKDGILLGLKTCEFYPNPFNYIGLLLIFNNTKKDSLKKEMRIRENKSLLKLLEQKNKYF